MMFVVFAAVLGVLITVHEWGHFIAARLVKVKVDVFSFGFGRRLFGFKRGDTDYSIRLFPLGGYVKLAGDNRREYTGKPDEFLSKTPLQRTFIVLMGPVCNYLLGLVFLWVVFMIGMPTLTSLVGAVKAGYGAEAAGIMAGDRIISINGEKVVYFDEMRKKIRSQRDAAAVHVELERAGTMMTLEVPIHSTQVDDGIGGSHRAGMIGVLPSGELVKVVYGPLGAAWHALEHAWDITDMTCTAFWRMITGKLSIRESIAGPLGIFFVTSEAAQMGIAVLMHLIALLSLSLAIFNVLPLPVLDGGHLLLLAIERVRGRPLSANVEMVLTNIGMTMLLSLALFVTYNDIARAIAEHATQAGP